MNQLSAKGLRGRAWAFAAGSKQLVRLRIGSADYVLDHQEATALAAQLVKAVEQAGAAQ